MEEINGYDESTGSFKKKKKKKIDDGACMCVIIIWPELTVRHLETDHLMVVWQQFIC